MIILMILKMLKMLKLLIDAGVDIDDSRDAGNADDDADVDASCVATALAGADAML